MKTRWGIENLAQNSGLEKKSVKKSGSIRGGKFRGKNLAPSGSIPHVSISSPLIGWARFSTKTSFLIFHRKNRRTFFNLSATGKLSTTGNGPIGPQLLKFDRIRERSRDKKPALARTPNLGLKFFANPKTDGFRCRRGRIGRHFLWG